jgi:hypothetical protein
LDAVEAELLRRLLARLPAVAATRDGRFFVTHEFNPFGLPLSASSEDLAELAREALAIRTALGESVETSVGYLFRTTLAELADLDNHQRLGPGRAAERLLEALRGL